ncbi:hypothetical protein E2C01_027274 [Portunus trituberculatus]|uniref:Uncharacterized protein n=1 Tax=Portunus trituberculatus TaxID=210409 RepID=A0A5B7EL40_PORTR|nr:hypothetical protein [Portunus trituberculatus]
MSTQYRYFGACVKISSAQPPGRQTHPIVRDLLDRLQKELYPLQWLTNNLEFPSLRLSLGLTSPIPSVRATGPTLIKSVSSVLRSVILDVLAADVLPGPSPWMLPTSEVSFTPTTKTDSPPALQLQLALQHVATVTSSLQGSHRIYTDRFPVAFNRHLDNILLHRFTCSSRMSHRRVFTG